MTEASVSKPWRDRDGRWVCTAHLPAWHDLLEASIADRIECIFLTDENEPDAELVRTLRRVVEHQSSLKENVIGAMTRHYHSVRSKYVALARKQPNFMGDPDVSMPENPNRVTFAALHQLQALFVHPIMREGLAYVGFSFNAHWEPEHGLGVMAHDGRVVEVGGADTAFLTWIAEKDLEAAPPVRH
jgi:hypothetical protein